MLKPCITKYQLFFGYIILERTKESIFPKIFWHVKVSRFQIKIQFLANFEAWSRAMENWEVLQAQPKQNSF